VDRTVVLPMNSPSRSPMSSLVEANKKRSTQPSS
jgi:hypothetical protein